MAQREARVQRGEIPSDAASPERACERLEPTERTRVRRLPNRGAYERETIDAILDEGLVAHVAFVDAGEPVVLPMAYARAGDRIFLHGSTRARMLATIASGEAVCLTVTLIDGLVLARSAFHHSMNYRSVAVFGRPRLVEDEREKERALLVFTERLVPGRWPEIRPPSAKELRATAVACLALEEASAKLRSGGPLDDPEDLSLPVWAGVVPIALCAGEPEPDAALAAGTPVAEHVLRAGPRLRRVRGAAAPPAPRRGGGAPGRRSSS